MSKQTDGRTRLGRFLRNKVLQGKLLRDKSVTIRGIKLRIIKNDYDEYEVQWIEDGVINREKTYYTDDYLDAIATRRQMAIEIIRGVK